LTLYPSNIDREEFNEVSDAVTFLASQLRLLYRIDLFRLHGTSFVDISTRIKITTYDVPFEETFQPCMLFVQEVYEKCFPSFFSVRQEMFESSHDANDLSKAK
jgi:hypothetical protein